MKLFILLLKDEDYSLGVRVYNTYGLEDDARLALRLNKDLHYYLNNPEYWDIIEINKEISL